MECQGGVFGVCSCAQNRGVLGASPTLLQGQKDHNMLHVLLDDQARLTMMRCVKCRLYYMALLLGTPPKLYFLDVDTGSDLTWLQCDAPCRSCAPVSEYHSALASCLS